jgi:hypothetical protein
LVALAAGAGNRFLRGCIDLLRFFLRWAKLMGHPNVIDEQPGDLVSAAELEGEAKRARQVAEATRLAGPKPATPTFFVERGLAPWHVDPTTGFIVQDGPDPGFFGDPNAEAIATAYGADIAAWNQRFQSLLAAVTGQVTRVTE